MEHDLCDTEPPEQPDNPVSEPTKSIETNKTPVQVKKRPIDYSKYRTHFLGIPVEKIKATFQATTQFATNVMAGSKILQTIKSPWPANNVLRRNEPVATDTIKAQVPAIEMEAQWHNYLSDADPLYLMLMVSKLMLLSSIPLKTTYDDGEQWTNSSVMVLNQSSPTAPKTSFVPYASMIGTATPIINIRTSLNIDGVTSRRTWNGL